MRFSDTVKILTLVSLLVCSSVAQACSTCFGDPDHLMSKGINMGVIVMLGVIGCVLVLFLGLILFFRKRSQMIQGRVLDGNKTSQLD